MASILRTSCRFAVSVGLYAAPLVVSTGLANYLTDQKVAKIAGGAILFFSGITGMAKAVVRRADGGGKAASVALGGIGLGMSIAGVAQASLGVMEIFHPALFLQSCEDLVEMTQLEILQCPATKAVWDSVQAEGPISIECTKKVDEVAGIIWELTQKIIYVSRDLKEGFRSKFVNALVSLDGYKLKTEFLKNACKLTASSFAYQMEKMEWQAIQKTYQLGKKCIAKGFWPSNWLMYRENFESSQHEDDWSTFDKYFAKMKQLGHTVLYEQIWRRNCLEPAHAEL